MEIINKAIMLKNGLKTKNKTLELKYITMLKGVDMIHTG